MKGHLMAKNQLMTIRRLGALGESHYNIAKAFDISLSEVRRALDSRAQWLHEQWKR